jgi:hypothetical protein
MYELTLTLFLVSIISSISVNFRKYFGLITNNMVSGIDAAMSGQFMGALKFIKGLLSIFGTIFLIIYITFLISFTPDKVQNIELVTSRIDYHISNIVKMPFRISTSCLGYGEQFYYQNKISKTFKGDCRSGKSFSFLGNMALKHTKVYNKFYSLLLSLPAQAVSSVLKVFKNDNEKYRRDIIKNSLRKPPRNYY